MKKTLAACLLVLCASQAAFANVEEEVAATFEQFVVAQNAHDAVAVRDLLSDAPGFLWISRGVPIWGRDAAIKRFEMLYQGTWTLAPDRSRLRVTVLNEGSAQLFIPVVFSIGNHGEPASDSMFFMNQTLVKTAAGWRISSILPIPGK